MQIRSPCRDTRIDRVRSLPTPVLQALVLADHIYTDQSGKRIICGTFSRILCAKFPSRHEVPTWAFILLADVLGRIALQLRFVHLNRNELLMQSAPLIVESSDKLTPIDLAIRIPVLPLPEPGTYSVECCVDDILLGSVRLLVDKMGVAQ